MYYLVEDDLVLSYAQRPDIFKVDATVINGGAAQFHPDRYRYDGGIVDAANYTDFFIDSDGVKHVVQHDAAWQALSCQWDDELQFDGANWAVVSDATLVARLAASKIKILSDDFTTSLAVLTDPYPAVERESWRIQEAEARAYALSNSAAIPFIDALVAAEVVSVASKVADIIAKADAFRGIVATAVGNRQRLEDQVIAIGADSNLTLQQKTDQINEVVWS